MAHQTGFTRRAALCAPILAAITFGAGNGAHAQAETPRDDKAIDVIAADIPDGIIRLSLSLAERIGVPEDGRLTIAVTDDDGITIARTTTTTGRQPYVVDLQVAEHTSWPLTVKGTFGSLGDGGTLSASAILEETAAPAVVSLSLIINRSE